MAKVLIEHLSDTSDHCELCGPSYAEGARIIVDGEEVSCMEPIASCTGGQHFTSEDIMRAVLQHFGHELEGMTY